MPLLNKVYCLILLMFFFSVATSCQTGNHSDSSSKKKQPSAQIIVKLKKGESIDSLLRSFAKYELQPIQNLSDKDNMWLVSAKVDNGYALVEIIREMEIVQAAELSTAEKPASGK
ncbi:MAG: hypothetical protein IPM47_18440 [Sphingobacteriales bacterium]|nr:MAG: hypothetical protein IPM47_18440 [Sphingobacteriales bacterium]